MLKGIDVSVWQGSIDWSKTKNEIDFAILRAGYGRHVSQKDDRFEEYYAACEKYNIPRVLIGSLMQRQKMKQFKKQKLVLNA